MLLPATGTDEAPETDAVEKRVEVRVSTEVEGLPLLTGATGLLLPAIGAEEGAEEAGAETLLAVETERVAVEKSVLVNVSMEVEWLTTELTPLLTGADETLLLTGEDETPLAVDTERVAVEKIVLVNVSMEVEWLTTELTPELTGADETPLLTGEDETLLAVDTERVAVEKIVLVRVSVDELTPELIGEDGTALPVVDETAEVAGAEVAGAEAGVELVRAETSELDGTTTIEVLFAGMVTEMVEVKV